ncbi:hypothetical protein D3C87_1612180 [compost metagenome]
MALGDALQFFLKNVDVERHGQAENLVGIDLHRDRRQHPLLVLLQQIGGQALGRGILFALGAEAVPADLHRYPFLGPVTAEPGDEVFFGQLIDPGSPVIHGTARVDLGLLGGRLRRCHDLPVHLLPGALGNHHRRGCHRGTRRRDAPRQHHQHGDDQRTQVQDRGFLQSPSGRMPETQRPIGLSIGSAVCSQGAGW